jgi:hypothetical protein
MRDRLQSHLRSVLGGERNVTCAWRALEDTARYIKKTLSKLGLEPRTAGDAYAVGRDPDEVKGCVDTDATRSAYRHGGEY